MDAMIVKSKKMFWRNHQELGNEATGGIGSGITLPKGSEIVGVEVVNPNDWSTAILPKTTTEVWVVYHEPSPVPEEVQEFRLCVVTDGQTSMYPKSKYLRSFRHSPDSWCHVYLDLDSRLFVEQMREKYGPRWGTPEWVEEFVRAQKDWEEGQTPTLVHPDAH
jgi:hypothetical protein